MQLVAGANGAGTSVVLVVESTFIETLGRGEVPPGLRAPEGGTAPNITGNWSITGIPDGKYVVLAAFENDGNVRDPDPGISGTQLQRITVANGAVSGASSPSFKVTGAVGLVSPGAEGVEATGATPTFKWEQYSNADGYVLKVFDTLGIELWQTMLGDKHKIKRIAMNVAIFFLLNTMVMQTKLVQLVSKILFYHGTHDLRTFQTKSNASTWMNRPTYKIQTF